MKRKYNDKRLISQILKERHEGISYREIGKRNNIPESTAYWLVQRYRKKNQSKQKSSNVTPAPVAHTLDTNKSQQYDKIPTWLIVTGVILLASVIGLVFYAVTDIIDQLHKDMIHYD